MRDEWFIRGDIPMTKSEVRAVSISKLELHSDSVVYDIGAGTGSVSVEMAMQVPEGHVYAFEQKEEGCALILANAKKAGVKNLTVVSGKAPESLSGYPAPDRVFLGGSGGKMEEILDLVTKLNPAVQIVVNVIALESLSKAMAWFQKKGWEPEVVCMQVSCAEKRGPYHMMQAQNPIYILTAQGPETREFVSREHESSVQTSADPAQNFSNQQVQASQNLPRILLAAPGSGSGKTLITTGLLTMFQNRGIRCHSFKCGPDYIDPMFHKYVLGIDSCNLDSFFLSENELNNLFQRRAEGAELSVLEGVMGYYDGIGGNSTAASTYEIAKITDTPVILVVDGKGSSLSLAAQIKGFLEYQKDSHICGVILNKTNQMVGERLRSEIEKLGVKYLGAVPVCEAMDIKSRHLGLTMPKEQNKLRQNLDAFSEQLAKFLDVDGILELAGYLKENLPNEKKSGQEIPTQKGIESRRNLPAHRMAVAMDEAFCFYYQENLDFLRQNGWELIPFSPLHDAALPKQIQAVLLGGGYPELYAKELSANHKMRKEIQNAHTDGIKILAECGGFLYLQEDLEDETGKRWPMAGLIHADGFRTGKLGRFGYISLEQNGVCQIKGHEFHYWDSTAPGTAFHAAKPQSNRGWDCMYQTDRLLAGFPHLYYLSGPDLILNFLSDPAKEREKPS